MENNFGVFDIFYDSQLQAEVDKLLKRVQRPDSKWYLVRKDDDADLPALSNYKMSLFRSPRVDFEMCKSVFAYLQTQQFSSGDMSSESNHISLEGVLRRKRKNGRTKLAVPLKQQMELALLWYVGCFSSYGSSIKYCDDDIGELSQYFWVLMISALLLIFSGSFLTQYMTFHHYLYRHTGIKSKQIVKAKTPILAVEGVWWVSLSRRTK